jgi:hypothetical protein
MGSLSTRGTEASCSANGLTTSGGPSIPFAPTNTRGTEDHCAASLRTRCTSSPFPAWWEIRVGQFYAGGEPRGGLQFPYADDFTVRGVGTVGPPPPPQPPQPPVYGGGESPTIPGGGAPVRPSIVFGGGESPTNPGGSNPTQPTGPYKPNPNGPTYLPGGGDTYEFVRFGGGGPVAPEEVNLDFSDPDNSHWLGGI